MIIWITGASSGLGRELARQYAQAGHQVCVSARGVAALDELAASCRDASGAIHVFGLDITDMLQVSACVQSIVESVGKPDLSVLNAGTHRANSAKLEKRAQSASYISNFHAYAISLFSVLVLSTWLFGYFILR